MRDPGSELAERGKLFRLDEPVLRGPQVLYRSRQFLRALLLGFEQPYVLNGDCRLVSKSRCKFNLLVGERPYCIARQHYDANRHTLPQQRDTKDGTKPPKPLAFSQCVFWISLNVIYLDRFTFGHSTPKHRAAPRNNRSLPHVSRKGWSAPSPTHTRSPDCRADGR